MCDCVSSVPTSFLALVNRHAASLDFLRVFRVCKIFRLIKCFNHFKALKDLEQEGKGNPSVVRLFKTLATFTILLHIVACCYWTVVIHSCELNESTAEFDTIFFCPEPWRVVTLSGTAPSLYDKYWPSFYWAILAMLGENAKPGIVAFVLLFLFS